MKKYGLIGYPIAHSQSPALFRAAYKGAYPYELIEENDFDTAYRRFLADYEGINVTAPFKELAYGRADLLSEEVRLIKAANLLVKTPEGVKAYNSDYLAVRKWLEETISNFPFGYSPNVLTVGCGGAGKAAAIASGTLGLRTALLNRTPDRAKAIVASVRDYCKTAKAADISADSFEIVPFKDFTAAFSKADIVIYTLPLAIEGLASLHEVSAPSGIATANASLADMQETCSAPQRKFLLEANYKNPSFTPELLEKLPGVSYTPGTVWLLYQAHTGYPILTGEAIL